MPAPPVASATAVRTFVRRRTPWVAGLLLLLTAWAAFAHLGSAPPGRMSEQRCHRVAAHMVKSGDWIVPIDHGAPRLQKPPLYYWLAASAITVAGDATYAVTRAPSALAAVLLALLTFRWASRRGGALAGIVAMCALLATDQFQDNARRGDAEMVFALASVAALLAFQRSAESGRGRDLAWFAVAFALACLAKATAAIVTVLVPIAAWAVFDARVRARLDRGFALAVIAAACAGFAWYGVVLTRVVGAWRELVGHAARPLGVDEAGGDADHYRAPYFFVKQLPSILGPVVLALPLLVSSAWRMRTRRSSARVPALAFAAAFVVFSALPQKQPHYLLPVLPALCVWVGLESQRCLRQTRFPTRWVLGSHVARATLVVAAAALAALCGAAHVWATSFLAASDAIAAALALTGGAVAIVALGWGVRGNTTRAWSSVLVALAFVMAVRAAHVTPWRARISAAVEGESVAGALDDVERARVAAASHRVVAWIFDVDDALTVDRER